MSIQIRSLILGIVLTVLVVIAGVVVLFILISHETNKPMTTHYFALPSGKTIKVTAFHIAWGVDHDDRRPDDDQFEVDYISSAPNADLHARDQESLEAFELIRPLSELYGFKKATLCAFPTAYRKGRYDIYRFDRSIEGKWTYQRHEARVHIND